MDQRFFAHTMYNYMPLDRSLQEGLYGAAGRPFCGIFQRVGSSRLRGTSIGCSRESTRTFDSFEKIARSFDAKDDFSAGAVVARNSIVRAEQRMMDARERLAIVLEARSSFLNARVVATRRLGASDSRGKASHVADGEEELDNPKFLKRKLPEPS